MGIKRNFAYSSVLMVSNYLFPLLTYPYVARVIGVSGIGICNFVDSLINYFVLFSMMGISACGIREIASNKGSNKLSRIFTSIFALNAVSTLIAIVVLLVAMYVLDSLAPYRNLLYVGLCKLVMNLFMVEWFYKGMEDFAYITKRSLIIKCMYVASVFVFIRHADDYPMYYVLSVAMVVINALVNIVHSHKYVHFCFSGIDVRPYLPTFFSMGIYMIITSFYSSLNVTWLGFATDNIQVGYYSTAMRLYTIVIAVYTAFTNVMFPRQTALLSEGRYEEFWRKITMSLEVLFAIAFPIVAVAFVMGPNILHLFAGDGFEGAYMPFRIIVPLIIIIGYEQILVLQILLPMKRDRVVLRNSVFGALLALLINILLVSRMGAVGSAIVWLASEILVLTLSHAYLVRHTPFEFPLRSFIKYVCLYVPMVALLVVMMRFEINNDLILLILGGVITFAYTLIVQVRFVRNEIILQLINRIGGSRISKWINNSKA